MSLEHLCGHYGGIDFIPLGGSDIVLHRSASVDIKVAFDTANVYNYRLHFNVRIGLLSHDADGSGNTVLSNTETPTIAVQLPVNIDLYTDALEDFAEDYLRMTFSQSNLSNEFPDWHVVKIQAIFNEETKQLIRSFHTKFTKDLIAYRSNEL